MTDSLFDHPADPPADHPADPPAEQSMKRVADTEPVVVYTDGACSGNPGPGGWGWAVAPTGEPCGSGGEAHTTNQRMELMAVLEALRSLGVGSEAGPVTVVSDSTYVVNCFRDGWWVKWRRNGWKNSKKEPVANTDIWQPLVEIVQSGEVTFQWVMGHWGDPMHDLVDELVVAAVPVV